MKKIMGRKFLTGCALLFLLCALGNGMAGCRQSDREEEDDFEAYYQPVSGEDVRETEDGLHYADSQLLLTAESGVSFEEMEALLQEHGGTIVGYISDTGDYQVQFEPDMEYQTLETLAGTLSEAEEVASAGVSYVMQLELDSVDYRNDCWKDSENPDSTSGSEWDTENPRGLNWWAEALNLPGVWDQDLELEEVKVGILDTMFDVEQKDLENVFVEAWNNPADEEGNCRVAELYASDEENSSTYHGTHVAGIIGAEGGNEAGITGISANARLYGFSLLSEETQASEEGQWETCFLYKYAIARFFHAGVRVINISMSVEARVIEGSAEGNQADIVTVQFFNDQMEEFLSYYIQENWQFLIVKAAGNNYGLDAELDILSGIDNEEVKKRILVVGAAALKEDGSYRIADLSNVGDRVDFWAPGVDILSLMPGDTTKKKSGTSMAAPMITGLCSLIWGTNPELTAEQVVEILRLSQTLSLYQSDAGHSVHLWDIKEKSEDDQVSFPDAALCVSLAQETAGEAAEANNADVALVLGVIYGGTNEEPEAVNLEWISLVSEEEDSEEYIDLEPVAGAGEESIPDLLYYSAFLPAGEYSIEVQAEGYQRQRQEFSLEAGDVLQLDFQLKYDDLSEIYRAVETLKDFNLAVEGEMSYDWQEESGAEGTTLSAWEYSGMVRGYGGSGMTASGSGSHTITSAAHEGNSSENQYAFTYQYRDETLQRTDTLPFPGTSYAELTPLEYLDLRLPEEEYVTASSFVRDEEGNSIYRLWLDTAALNRENSRILLHVLDYTDYFIDWTNADGSGGFDQVSLQVELDSEGNLTKIYVDYVVNASVELPFQGTGTTLFRFEESTAPDLASGNGWWLQQDVSNPYLLICQADGSLTYYATVTQAETYYSSYSQEGDTVWLNLVNLDVSGVTPVAYRITAEEENVVTLTLEAASDPEERALLYGIEELLAGSYRLLWFTQEQLQEIRTRLQVPEDAQVEITQGDPYYWQAGERWLISVGVYENGDYVAGAAFDPVTQEMCTNIFIYSR